ncbi:MAG: lamin tail domain-containing protein, partial [Sedimentisphaerales bacterium]|nr:lamin tail domain-containing protein [Sedimentisphaerales bacterium]
MTKKMIAITVLCLGLLGTASAWEDGDIGSVGAVGSVEVAGDTYTIHADGGDIWGTADAFHYMYLPMTGDGELMARVVSVQNTDSWAKAGVMIRETLGATSTFAMIVATPGNGVAFQYRASTNGDCQHYGDSGLNAPQYVKIVRTGGTITGYSSANGSAPWTSQGSASISMAADVYVGLCVTSHSNGVLCTAVFDSIDGTVATGAWRAVNVSPPTGALQIDPEGTTLRWEAGAEPPEPIDRFAVYFSNDTAAIGQPTSLRCEVAAGQSLECFTGPLAGGTTYYWRVDSIIDGGDTAVGSTWNFTTGVEPIKVCPDGDIDGDCHVTGKDLLLLSQQWLDEGLCTAGADDCAELAGSDVVDAADYSILAADWTKKVGPVVINEIHYDPDVKTELAEFVELYNVTDESVNIGGWQFTRGIEFVFQPGTLIPPDGYLVVAQNPAKFQAKFGFAPFGPFAGKLGNDSDTITLRDADNEKVDEVSYQLGFPWPTVGESVPAAHPPTGTGHSIQLINPGMDNDLGGSWRSKSPTPGGANLCLAANAPPLMRQVDHTPNQPVGGETVKITVKVTDSDGVDSVTLAYQVVEPGDYIAMNDARFATNWTYVQMFDDGTHGDVTPHNDKYTAIIPAEVQVHRRLIRYWITAVDGTGLSITGPYTDDPQPNFAYFVYDGVPAWHAAIKPGDTGPLGDVIEYSPEVLQMVPVYHLISKKSDVETATWFEQYWGADYKWYGTLVYDGRVYDHIRYRMRGGVWRYAMGKNMWKFDFNRGHYFQARDDYGNKYDTKWDKVNFSAAIQQGNFGQRGEQAMFEAVTFAMFNLAGVPASKTSYLHFRVIDEQYEDGLLNAAHSGLTTSGTQYDGDFWGLYMNIEQMDNRFLMEHNLPDGNLYKMESGYGERNNQGAESVTDFSDIRDFKNTYESSPSAAWWQANVNLDRFYSHVAVQEAAHHGDITNKNHFFYNNPETGLWTLLPWDVDLTWTTYYGDPSSDPFRRENIFSHSTLDIANKNRAREFCDLLFNPDQMGQLIDEYASFINDPEGGLSIVDADRAMWDYHWVVTDPACSPYGYRDQCGSNRAGTGKFYEEAEQRGYDRSFEGMTDVMKEFVVERQTRMNSLSADSGIPNTPVIRETTGGTYPINSLRFAVGPFSDPQGNAFAAMKWRIAEVAEGSQATYTEPPGTILLPEESSWKYFKGRKEPSDPQSEWRELDFYENADWLDGTTPIGYGETWIDDPLTDMRYDYTTLYFRKEFQVDDVDAFNELLVEARYDDGAIMWINNVYACSGNAPATQQLCTDTAANRPENHDWGTVDTLDPAVYLVEGRNIVVAQVINQAADSSDCFFDLRLTGRSVEDPPVTPSYGGSPGKYEIEPVWETEEMTAYSPEIWIPGNMVRPGHTYRVRCRMKDSTGRWSHWSDPNQFVVGEAVSAGILDDLRITEVMYNPLDADTSKGELDLNNDEFEFIELKNVGDEVLDLSYVSFIEGITFDFNGSDVTSVGPGAFVLAVRYQAAFESRYPGLSDIIAGQYISSSSQLSNSGETVQLADLWNGTIVSFSYSDGRGWPLPADGSGHSLV